MWIDIISLPREYSFVRYELNANNIRVQYRMHDFIDLEKSIDLSSAVDQLSTQLYRHDCALKMSSLPSHLHAKEIHRQPDIAQALAISLAEDENLPSSFAPDSSSAFSQMAVLEPS